MRRLMAYIKRGEFQTGLIDVFPWGNGDFRPSIWFRVPGGWIAIFFGWQWPSVLVLR